MPAAIPLRLRSVCTGVVIPLTFLVSLGAAPAGTGAAPRPDIVTIMVDDLDVGSLRDAVDAGFMPHLQQYILDGGTRFTESFVTLALCCPSRSTYLSGLYPHNHGVVRNSGPSGGFPAFQGRFDETAPLAAWLETSGYRTAHVGKYLNGYTDYTVVPRGWTEWRGLVDPTTYCMYNFQISENGTRLIDYGADPGEPADEYQTDVLASLAASIIASGDARPLFLNVAPLAPHRESSCLPDGVRPAPRHAGSVHLPLPAPPSFNEADMSDKPEWMRRLPRRDPAQVAQLYVDRIAALRAVDDLIGTVAQALQAAGRLERTAFLFTSDNGYLLGLHRWESKILVYEASIRVPLAIRLPGGRQVAQVDRIALNNDLAPTIVDLAGATAGYPMDGQSLLPLVRGATPSWRTRFLIEFPPVASDSEASLGLDRDGPRAGEPASAIRALPPFFAVRSSDSALGPRLVYAETLNAAGGVSDRELYDLAADPYQLQSLHEDASPQRLAQRRVLKQQLERLKTCGAGSCEGAER